MRWWNWCCGFLAGAALASYLTLSCAPGHAQSQEVAGAIHEAATTYGVAERCLLTIAYRESRFSPQVTNASGHRGLFQYADRTWWTMSRWAGFSGASPYDPYAAAMVTAFALSHPWTGGLRHWGGRC